MWSNTLDKISFWSLFLTIVLLPVVFIPFTKIPIGAAKGLILIVGLSIAVIFWIAARFSDGRIVLPRSLFLLSGLGVVLVFLFSAIFSSARGMSFFGIMFDVGSFWFMLAAFILLALSSMVLWDPRHARKILSGILLTSAVVVCFQILRLFFPELLSLGVLGGKTDNILGSWSALGLWTGFTATMSLFLLEFFPVSRRKKWLLGIFLLLCLILISAVSFSLIWILVGIFAVLIFIYKISLYSREGGGERSFPGFSLAISLLALLFLISGQFIGNFVPAKLGLSVAEVRPSLSSTLSVLGSGMAKDPVLGLGPNRFGDAWAMYKPAKLNNSRFWNTSFDTGSGLIPTLSATTGALGILSLLLFFVLFVSQGVKSLFSNLQNRVNLESGMFFIGALYLFIASFFYPIGTVIFLLAMACAGISLGLSAAVTEGKIITFSFLNDPRKSFFSILLLVAAIAAIAALSFKYFERFGSVYYFTKALSAQNIEASEAAIGRALSFNPNDLYWRTFAQIELLKANSIAAKGAIAEEDRTNLQTSLNQAVGGSLSAANWNPENYFNFQNLAGVYDTLASYGVAGSTEKAIEAYKRAAELNPLNPGLKLAIAIDYRSTGDTAQAKDYALLALQLKPDYVNALIFLSQLERTAGNLSEALSYAERALALTPNDAELINYVKSLRNSGGGSQ